MAVRGGLRGERVLRPEDCTTEFISCRHHLQHPAPPGIEIGKHDYRGNPQDKPKDDAQIQLETVHSGGFYHAQKYPLGPKGEPLSPDLHWFKWEAYWTWISGMGLLAIIYWWGANTYLIDRSVLELSVPAAIVISAASLVAGWLIY